MKARKKRAQLQLSRKSNQCQTFWCLTYVIDYAETVIVGKIALLRRTYLPDA